MKLRNSFSKQGTTYYQTLAILPNLQETINCPFCNTEDTNVYFIHYQKMDDNQDLLNLIQSFWNKFSNSNWINWDWILKGWINKSIVRCLDVREIKVYDQKKLKIVLSLQKRWNLRCSFIKKKSTVAMLSLQDEDTPAD
jgi:hypothetical protein